MKKHGKDPQEKQQVGQLFRLMASLCYLKRLRQSNMHTVQIPDVIKTYNISHEPKLDLCGFGREVI